MISAFLLTALITLGGCHQTLRGTVVQPNPVTQPTETLKRSETVVIYTGDKDLRMPAQGTAGRNYARPTGMRRYKLRNQARFVVVSKNRLRFEVAIEHKWRSYSDPAKMWRATLVDDRGHIYLPEHTVSSEPQHITKMWDQETRVAGTGMGFSGDVARGGGTPLGSLSFFRGKALIQFHEPELIGDDTRSFTLVLERPGQALIFSWRFTDPEHAKELFGKNE